MSTTVENQPINLSFTASPFFPSLSQSQSLSLSPNWGMGFGLGLNYWFEFKILNQPFFVGTQPFNSSALVLTLTPTVELAASETLLHNLTLGTSFEKPTFLELT